VSVRDKAWFPVVYMFAVTAAFSSVLIGFAEGLRPRVESNRRAALERAVLAVLPLEAPAADSAQIRHELFKSLTAVTERGAEKVTAYQVVRDGRVRASALLFEGQGFWNRIRGVIGVGADGRSVLGIAIYEQSETPGLGAEIVTPRFTEQFRKGKVLGVKTALRFVAETAKAGSGEVNGVTGATQTCSRLERMLNARLARWTADTAQPGGTE